MKNTIYFSLLLLAVGGSGCTTFDQAPQPVSAPFVMSDYDAYLGDGSGEVQGQAFLRTKGGRVIYGAGREVCLVPVSDYTTEVVREYLQGTKKMTILAPGWYDVLRKTTADADGRFKFNSIPDGDYYVWCGIFYSRRATTYNDSGMVVVRQVTVEAGKKIDVILTQ